VLDLVVLVADKNMKFAFEGLLLNRRLTIRALDAAVFPHPKRDPGVLRQCHDFLRSQQRLAAYAVVMFDRAGCGSEESRVVLESEVEARMAANGWVGRSAAVVIDPELEEWVWAGYSQIEQTLGWPCGHGSLEEWLIRERYLYPGQNKPAQPKKALEHALHLSNMRRSSAFYSKLAKAVDFERCTDAAFAKLRAVLAAWFPKQAG
jgi:hypothetical protein